MKNLNYSLFILTLGVVFVACDSVIEENFTSEQPFIMKAEPVEDEVFFSDPDGEFFMSMGELHNEFLDYFIDSDLLSQIPIAYNNSGTYLPIEINLLEDLIFRSIVLFLDEEFDFSLGELGVLNNIQNTIYSSNFDYRYYMLEQIPNEAYELKDYWHNFHDIIENSAGNYTLDSLEVLYENCCNSLNLSRINEKEFELLFCLSIGKSSVAYWTNNNMMNYAIKYKYLDDIDFENSFKWWGSDIIGGLKGFLFSGGNWIGGLFGAISFSVTHLLHEYVLPVLLTNSYMIFQEENTELKIIYYRDDSVLENYNLFDMTIDSDNPYLTGDYVDLELPLNLSY